MATHDPEDAVESVDGGTSVEFEVTPNADTTRVPSGFDEWRGRFEARLSRRARDGEANDELVDELESLLASEVVIERGKTSRRKTVVVDLGTDEVLSRLRESL
ncbi:MAG: DUF167 family protein [Halobacteria archaeon]|nr:DUF167 family protein [Halobacteria archaeon]